MDVLLQNLRNILIPSSFYFVFSERNKPFGKLQLEARGCRGSNHEAEDPDTTKVIQTTSGQKKKMLGFSHN